MLTGVFDPFLAAIVDATIPTVRLRAQFSSFGDDASALTGTYDASFGGQEVTAGDIGAVAVVPEPISIVLVGTGLLGVGAAAARRKRSLVEQPDENSRRRNRLGWRSFAF